MRNIVLIGFMGTGKTSAGRLIASRMGYSFVDTDARIEAVNHMTVSEMFAAHGEAYFRRKETEIIINVSELCNAVIATGGGVVLNPENIKLLRKNGVIISLSASVDVILERTGRRNARPLLEQSDRRQAVLTLLASRAELYKQADFTVDTTDLSPIQVSEEVIGLIRREVTLRA